MDKDKIRQWASNLTEDETREALIQLVEFGIETDSIYFGKNPYWESCGEPLVPGQQLYNDE